PQRVSETGLTEGTGTGSESSRCLSPFPARPTGPAKRGDRHVAVLRASPRFRLPSTCSYTPSGTELIELGPDRLDERAERLLPELEASPGRLEQLGERTRPTETESAAVPRHRPRAVGVAPPPDLERAELRDAVL